jgi:DNA invertase Pin-like site-specific DNA recombinase
MKRIAIYARKSVISDKGDSVKFQIQKCREHIELRLKDEEYEFIEYQDEGFTGANQFRPALQRLLRDISQGKINTLICYRLDRITRSVADFSVIYEILKKHGTGFISVSENFETTSPAGNAMLNIIIVFAELERNIISERIADNMFELAKTERWVSGKAPLGYKLHRYENSNKKKQTELVIDEETAPNVKLIFQKYAEFRSMSQLENYLLQNYIKSQNGNDLQTSQLALILKNPSYVKADERVKDFYVQQGAQFYGDVNGENGLMTYGKTKSLLTEQGKQGLTKNTADKWIISVGNHKGIIEPDIWLEAQKIMAENHNKFPHIQKSHTALVSGILCCAECGSVMMVSYGGMGRNNKKAYYYACKMRKKTKGIRCTNENARADKIDEAVRNILKEKHTNKELFLKDLKEQLKSGKLEIAQNPIEFIKSDIEKKENEIQRLVVRISRTDSDDLATNYENQIRSLKKDITSLSAELSAVSQKKTAVYETENILKYIERLLDKCGHVDELDLEEQRELVRMLFKKITWNAKTGELKVEYITDNDGGDNGGGGGSSIDNSDDYYDDTDSENISQFYSSTSQVIRNSYERFTAQTEPFALHRGGNHLKRFACADFVRQKRVAAVYNPRDCVHLMRLKFDFRRNAAESDVTAVVFARFGAVELFVVFAHERFAAVGVFENPVRERIFDTVLLFLREQSFVFVQHPVFFPLRIDVRVVNPHVAEIQRVADYFICVHARSAERCVR